ncbi:TPA: hypothetical protein QDZ84_003469 [Shewanella algae]|uniref:hypothetical protein n=1 Tax=Shewanella TaxID=22 RepID=UPI0014305FF1|nr:MULTISPECIES: hypothetical protein [Shewanella]NJI86935.1 hypothetical protein [Shewanella sp. Iso12]HDS1208430.1 hypothetical protein [Shewanella algae]
MMLLKTPENVSLIWKHTSSDFKGISDGIKTVMWAENGGSTLGPIECMPDDVFEEQLKFALRKEVCFQRDEKLLPIYRMFGFERVFSGTNQFREDFQTVLDVFKEFGSDDISRQVFEMIRDIYVPFPDGPDSDGIEVLDGVSEVVCPLELNFGMLKVVVERPNQVIVRVFECNKEALPEMYKQMLCNPHVIRLQVMM